MRGESALYSRDSEDLLLLLSTNCVLLVWFAGVEHSSTIMGKLDNQVYKCQWKEAH